MPVDASRSSLVSHLTGLSDVMAFSHDAVEFGRAAGLAERAAWELGIAVSELATNITRHASRGSIALHVVDSPLRGIAILASDCGPGIADVELALGDDYSQGQVLSRNVSPTDRVGLGSGLGAVMRLTQELTIESTVGRGTTIRAFKPLPPTRDPQDVVREAVLVLGLGNAILCDDGVGIKVVRHLAATSPQPGVDFVEAEVAGFALLDILEGYDRAVVVDAVRLTDARPGEVVIFSNALLEPSLHLAAGHQIDLPTALEMGRQLGRHVPAVVDIVGVQVQDDRTFSEDCTPAVEAAIEEAARVVMRIVRTRARPAAGG